MPGRPGVLPACMRFRSLKHITRRIRMKVLSWLGSIGMMINPMWSALRKLGICDVGRIPVVKRDDESHLVGIVRRRDIIQAYNMAIINRSRHQYRADIERLGKIVDSEFTQVHIPPGAGVVGKQISEIELPEECLIVSVHRGRKLYIAHGYTTLQAGDQLAGGFKKFGAQCKPRSSFKMRYYRDTPVKVFNKLKPSLISERRITE